jgi:hypothetical protein
MPIATPKPNVFALIGCEVGFCFMADFSLFYFKTWKGADRTSRPTLEFTCAGLAWDASIKDTFAAQHRLIISHD